ncbi:unnamed protein product [Meganyctiphanes norvegica]|uniref:Uncharacterized protein n=1 Tax=Meganyctiphanes norvegica TaxID=48144 RepID=A0AAV2R206_MEGNR
MLHDVSYQSGMIIDSCKEAKELNSIITLLKTIAGCARVLHEKFNEDGFDSKQLGVMLNLPLVLKVLLSYFKRSCQMPQLSHLAAECIMDVLELVLLYQCYHINVGDCPTNKLVLMYLKSLDNIEKVLKEVIIVKNPGKIVTSPVGQEILFKFKNPSNIVISPVGEEILLKYNKQLGYIFEACSDVGLDFLNAKWLWSCLIFLSVLGSD